MSKSMTPNQKTILEHLQNGGKLAFKTMGGYQVACLVDKIGDFPSGEWRNPTTHEIIRFPMNTFNSLLRRDLIEEEVRHESWSGKDTPFEMDDWPKYYTGSGEVMLFMYFKLSNKGQELLDYHTR